MDTRDEAIVELYFARNEDAIKESQTHYGPLCHQVSMNILHSRMDAEECVNDTWLRAWNSIPPTRPQSLRAFLCRIVRNLSLNRLNSLRAAKRDRDLTLSFEELEECIPLPEERAGDLSDLLTDFLSELPRQDRQLFVGRYWYAYPVKDLAQAHGLTPNAVSKRLGRIREDLRSYLEKEGFSI